MRIAIVHSFYSASVPSGENRVVEDQATVLSEAGHQVQVVRRRTDDEAQGALYPIRSATRVATGWGGDPTHELGEFAPDVVHVHNLFPNFGTRWAGRWRGPLVVSLHNYRAVCSNGLLFRDDDLCFECPTKGDVSAVRHACYRGSRLATLPVAVGRRTDRRALLGRASAVITTSAASDRQLGQFLGPRVKRVLIPNFGPDDGIAPLGADERSGWLAMGRFSPEKGFVELLEVWPESVPLTMIGEGELAAAVRSVAGHKNVTVRGSLPIDDLRGMLPCFSGLVFPSRWLEVAPQVVVEAMRVGLPVVAYRRNGVADFVESTQTGLSYEDAEDLQVALRTIEEQCDEFSNRAADHYRRNWRPSVWLERMTGLYAGLIHGEDIG
jgi:glycosyltransferase involved in cell wall biosynthesis